MAKKNSRSARLFLASGKSREGETYQIGRTQSKGCAPAPFASASAIIAARVSSARLRALGSLASSSCRTHCGARSITRKIMSVVFSSMGAAYDGGYRRTQRGSLRSKQCSDLGGVIPVSPVCSGYLSAPTERSEIRDAAPRQRSRPRLRSGSTARFSARSLAIRPCSSLRGPPLPATVGYSA